MQRVVRTGIALSALLAWSIAVAQNTMQPTQVAAEGTTTTTTAPAPEVPAGTEGQIISGVSNTALAAGAGAVVVGGAIIASQDDDDEPAATTTR
jgi:hypothetical protein